MSGSTRWGPEDVVELRGLSGTSCTATRCPFELEFRSSGRVIAALTELGRLEDEIEQLKCHCVSLEGKAQNAAQAEEFVKMIADYGYPGHEGTRAGLVEVVDEWVDAARKLLGKGS